MNNRRAPDPHAHLVLSQRTQRLPRVSLLRPRREPAAAAAAPFPDPAPAQGRLFTLTSHRRLSLVRLFTLLIKRRGLTESDYVYAIIRIDAVCAGYTGRTLVVREVPLKKQKGMN